MDGWLRVRSGQSLADERLQPLPATRGQRAAACHPSTHSNPQSNHANAFGRSVKGVSAVRPLAARLDGRRRTIAGPQSPRFSPFPRRVEAPSAGTNAIHMVASETLTLPPFLPDAVRVGWRCGCYEGGGWRSPAQSIERFDWPRQARHRPNNNAPQATSPTDGGGRAKGGAMMLRAGGML